jgi:hypothetical protein
MAWKILVDSAFAATVTEALARPGAPAAKVPPPPPPPVVTPKAEVAPPDERSALLLLSSLQREGRLVDFLQQEVAGFSDEEIGSAARVVHSGCKKVLQQYVSLKPIRTEAEGDSVQLASGFDQQQIRLAGNVGAKPPLKGALKHHGWIATEVKLPAVNPDLNLRVIAPAEVEIS